MSKPDVIAPAIRSAFESYLLAEGIRRSRIACILVVTLMPIGVVLDYFVYREWVDYLFTLRCMTSAGAALVYIGLSQPNLAPWQSRILCTGWYLVPAFFICWMIAATEGANSPYYAGLNLVILAVSSVLQATLGQSLVAIALICGMYILACVVSPIQADTRWVVNNGAFLTYTVCIVITGNFFYNRLRLREFVLRYELDENRQQLERSNQKLVELDQVKSRFFANISHELRTPLTLLLAPLEILLHRPAPAVEAATRATLGTMHANAMRLLKLINDLLDLVRLESGRMDLKHERLRADEFLCGLASSAAQMATGKRIALETRVDARLGEIYADRDKLEKIVLNLVFNALKFTPAGGRVQLLAEEEGEHIVIRVADTGVGIAAKNLPFVFDRFWQADNSSRRKFQGVGIGLALVKELAEVQGGTVSVESEEGQGTTFTVILPHLRHELQAQPAVAAAAPAATVASAGQAASAAPGPAASGPAEGSEEWLTGLYRRAELFPAGASFDDSAASAEPDANAASASSLHPDAARVLIAEDEPDMRRFLSAQIGTQYRVTAAANGVQAIDLAKQQPPDLVLLDMMMPEKDGLQVCRELRENAATKSTPVIVLTAKADEETKLAALSAGANDFLAKPFSTTELHVRVRNLLAASAAQRQLTKQNAALESTIDQLKHTETQLVQTEKIASLGRLSAGIIHEINNPLNFATTGLYTLRQKGLLLPAEQRPEFEEILSDVNEGLARVKSIVSDLRTFSHASSERSEGVQAAEIVRAALRFLSNEWKGRVRIDNETPEDLVLWINKNRLTQVVLNVLQNALDAMKKKTFQAEQPTIRIAGKTQGDRSALVLRDNGVGIAPENLGKIFDPFFTTKDVGEGMGLGLSICYRIVRDYQGIINVRSEQGRFCEVSIELPNRDLATPSHRIAA
jgi:signal transduction histidine kinase